MENAMEADYDLAEIAAFGLQLSVVLQACAESVGYRAGSLRGIASDISSTAGTLSQLQAIVDTDRGTDATARVFRNDGLREVEFLAAQCDTMYSAIIILLQRGLPIPEDEDVDPKNMKTIEFIGLRAGRDISWYWLEPRFRRLEGHLEWLKMALLFHLHIAILARFQIQNPTRAPGVFEEELALRRLADRLRKKHIGFVKTLAKEQAMNRIKIASSRSSYYSDSICSDKSSTVHGDEIKEFPVQDPKPTTTGDGNGGLSVDIKNELKPGNLFHEPQKPGLEETYLNSEFERLSTATPTEVDEASSPAVDKLGEKPKGGDEFVQDAAPEIKDPIFATPEPPGLVPKLPEPLRGLSDALDMVPNIPIRLETETQDTGILPSWIRSLFGIKPKIHDDKESEDLEAVQMHVSDASVRKLQFGNRQLHQALKRATTPKQIEAWDQFTSLDRDLRQQICTAIQNAHKLSARRKSCIALDVGGLKDNGIIVLFFALGGPVEPVHLTDAVGRDLTFPFEHCRKWKDMSELIIAAFKHIQPLDQEVREGRYDLVQANGDIILPQVWESALKPGTRLRMVLWPFQPRPPPVARLPPPFPPQPVPRPMGAPLPPGRGGPPLFVPAAPRPPPWPPMPNQWAGGSLPPGAMPYAPAPLPPQLSRPPPPVIDIVQVEKRPKRGRSVLSWMTPGSSASESVVDDELSQLGLDIDYGGELVKVKLTLGRLLGKWTNAPDPVGSAMEYDSDDSFSDSSSSSDSMVIVG